MPPRRNYTRRLHAMAYLIPLPLSSIFLASGPCIQPFWVDESRSPTRCACGTRETPQLQPFRLTLVDVEVSCLYSCVDCRCLCSHCLCSRCTPCLRPFVLHRRGRSYLLLRDCAPPNNIQPSHVQMIVQPILNHVRLSKFPRHLFLPSRVLFADIKQTHSHPQVR